MADAAVGHRQIFLLQLGPQGGEPPLGLDHADGLPCLQGHAGRVIAPVFQLGQTIQQYILGAAGAHIAYNATHKQNTSMPAGTP